MGGAFFFHVSAVASLLLSTLCGDPCQRLRGVLLHPRRPLDCIGPGAPLLRPSLAHHLVLAVLMPIPQMCPISCMRLRKKISERTCGINISNTSPHSSRRTRAACSRLTRQHATPWAAIRLSTYRAVPGRSRRSLRPQCTIAARAEQVARDLGVCVPWRQSRSPPLSCFSLS